VKAALKILVVEDSLPQMAAILETVRMAGCEPSGVTSLREAQDALASASFGALLTDIHLTSTMEQDSYEGLELLAYVRKNHPEMLCLAMSSDPKLETYRKALARGALHFFRKPIFSGDELAIGLEAARARRVLERVSAPASKLHGIAPDGLVIDEATRSIAQKVALSRQIPVVISGETGTGKEEIAKLIHRRRVELEGALPFVAVNCANLTGDLASSMLFGHRKGAFTGATETTPGYVGEADGGLLFLDEIHALPLSCQQRLLRVLNDGSYERVGDTKTLHSEFQVIAASTKDLDDEVDAGNFLLDLRMRLTGVDLSLLPLRKRREDLPLLVALFFAREGVPVPASEVARIADRCAGYTWKGNIRQLFKVLQSLVVMASFNGESIRAEDLPVFRSMVEGVSGERTPNALLGIRGLPADALVTLGRLLNEDSALEPAVDVFERMKIQATLARHDRVGEVARILDLARSTLDVKRKRHGL